MTSLPPPSEGQNLLGAADEAPQPKKRTARNRVRSTCAECGVSFPTARELEIHATTSRHKAWTCRQAACGVKFKDRSAFSKHMKKHTNPHINFPCAGCGHNFKRKDNLDEHQSLPRRCKNAKRIHNSLQDVLPVTAPGNISEDPYHLRSNSADQNTDTGMSVRTIQHEVPSTSATAFLLAGDAPQLYDQNPRDFNPSQAEVQSATHSPDKDSTPSTISQSLDYSDLPNISEAESVLSDIEGGDTTSPSAERSMPRSVQDTSAYNAVGTKSQAYSIGNREHERQVDVAAKVISARLLLLDYCRQGAYHLAIEGIGNLLLGQGPYGREEHDYLTILQDILESLEELPTPCPEALPELDGVLRRAATADLPVLSAAIINICKVNRDKLDCLLALALKNNSWYVVMVLVVKGADPNIPLDGYLHPTSALSLAMKYNYYGYANFLLAKGAMVETMTGIRTVHFSSMYEAIEKGHVELCKLMLDKMPLDSREQDQLLFLAASKGHHDIVEILFNKGADANTSDKESARTPLIAAVLNGHSDIIKILLDKGADANRLGYANSSRSREVSTPLMFAVRQGHAAAVRILLDNGARAASAKAYGEAMSPQYMATSHEFQASPLVTAAILGHFEITQILLQRGADPNELFAVYTVDPIDGVCFSTPLICAISSHNLATIELLLEHGAHLDETEFSVYWRLVSTPLKKAIELTQLDTVKLLLKHGARVDADSYEYCIHHSESLAQQEILELLIQAKEEQKYRGNTQV